MRTTQIGGRLRAPWLAALIAVLLIALPRHGLAQLEHARFTRVLREHVSDQGVSYARLQDDRAELDAYIAEIAAVTADEFAKWNRSDQIAYLLNAYNALVLATVIDHYPIKRSLRPSAIVRPANSVWQIGGFFDDIQHRVAGEKATLDMIEHSWLRPRYQEPRIHFALVCAAQSCPPLRAEAYVGDRLDEQLDDQARRFLTDGTRNRFDFAGGKVALSEIFKWFGTDFGERDRDVIDFVARYVDDRTRDWLRKGKFRMSHIDYDWNLNDAAAR